ncbi:MAG: sialidase family protein [Chloroflexota bacterium]
MQKLPPVSFHADPRNVRTGQIISDIGGYYDGQSIVYSAASNLLSVTFHHSHNREGGAGLRLHHTTSADGGITWSRPVPLEESLTEPSHDGYQLIHPDDPSKVYVFYGFNHGQLQYTVQDDESSTGERTVDLLRGDMQLDEGFRIKVSDDGGRTFNPGRLTIPVRRTAIDRNNPWQGETIGAFHCDKPSVIGGAVYFAFQKTVEGGGETPNSEAFIMRSKDFLKVDDPADATWETLPRGDHGLQYDSRLALGEEPHIFQTDPTDPNRVMVVWRTESGILACSTSSDGGEHFSEPSIMTYDGVRPIKNPRGAFTPHRFPNGEILLIYYNNGYTERDGYVGRRLYWYILGRYVDDAATFSGMIWSEPELALWWDGESLDDRPGWNADWAIVDGPGYADFTETGDGHLVFVESNKLTLRFHEVDPITLFFLRHQHELNQHIEENLVIDMTEPKGTLRSFNLPDVRSGAGGFTFILQLQANGEAIKSRQMLIDARETVTAALDEEDTGRYVTKGFTLSVVGRGAAGLQLCLTLMDGEHMVQHFTDGLEFDGEEHIISFTVDCGPRLVTSVVDGRLCDGGAHFPEGWTTLPPRFGAMGGADLEFYPAATVKRPHSGQFGGEILRFMAHNRPLLNSEVISTTRFLQN